MCKPGKIAALPQAVTKWLITLVKSSIAPLVIEQVIGIEAGKVERQFKVFIFIRKPPERSFHLARTFCIGQPGGAIEALPEVRRTRDSSFIDHFQWICFAGNTLSGSPEGQQHARTFALTDLKHLPSGNHVAYDLVRRNFSHIRPIAEERDAGSNSFRR